VTRRSNIDTLVIKDPLRPLAEGPIAVAVDGSTRSYGGLRTALLLAKAWEVPLQVLAAFDPYYHYVAFNRIADVLSEEASKVFRFKDQEKLHEEIIDSGLAKIYQGHLEVSKSIAAEHGLDVETVLLDGKPHEAIEKHLNKLNPSLLVVGKLGIHADPELDIGGNAEALLRNVDCAVLLSQRQHQPRVDVIADVTTSWTSEADKRMESVPSFAQSMVRMAILRFAQERGHTVVTESIVDEATAQLCPAHAREAMAEIVAAHDSGALGNGPAELEEMQWTDTALKLLQSETELSVRDTIQRRAEKKARRDHKDRVEDEHIGAFLPGQFENADGVTVETDSTSTPTRQATAIDGGELHWNAEALARLMRVPEGFMRDACRARIEAYARQHGYTDITFQVTEHGLEEARDNMSQTMLRQSPGPNNTGGCPFGHNSQTDSTVEDESLTWDSAAMQRLHRVPEGFTRTLTQQRVEVFARRRGEAVVTAELLEEKYAEWAAGSAKQNAHLHWDDAAWQRIQRIPEFVRGMVIKEMESCAQQLGVKTVTSDVMAHACDSWSNKGVFHSEAAPKQYVEDGSREE
jgi:nucleotide-binding universal stress UspA family protein